jgi:hypothetical protein
MGPPVHSVVVSFRLSAAMNVVTGSSSVTHVPQPAFSRSLRAEAKSVGRLNRSGDFINWVQSSRAKCKTARRKLLRRAVDASSRRDKTPLELYLAGVQSWEAG